MTDEAAFGVTLLGIVVWYYFRVRLIAFTEPMRDRLHDLVEEIEKHPKARKQDIEFARVLAPRALSGVYAWGLVVALVIYFTRSFVSRDYRNKLHREFAEMPEDYAKLFAEFTEKFTKSVFSNAPIAWLLFQIGMTLGRIAVVMRPRADANSMARVESRILVNEERALLNRSVARIFDHAPC